MAIHIKIKQLFKKITINLNIKKILVNIEIRKKG